MFHMKLLYLEKILNQLIQDLMKKIRSEFFIDEYILNKKNNGFSAGYNQAVKLNNTEFSLVLGPDCIISEKDIIILFEAVYYLENISRFLHEVKRVLRPNGELLLSTANCNLYDFNPSPFSVQYYGSKDLYDLLTTNNYSVELFSNAKKAKKNLVEINNNGSISYKQFIQVSHTSKS